MRMLRVLIPCVLALFDSAPNALAATGAASLSNFQLEAFFPGRGRIASVA